MSTSYEISKNYFAPIESEEIVLIQREAGKIVAQAAILPGSGANVRRYTVDGVDYLYPAPEPLVDKRHFGIPVLYPFPGLVRGCMFEFDGEIYRLKPNRGDFYRHGYVISEIFNVGESVVTDEQAAISLTYRVEAGHPFYQEFPIANELKLTYTLREKAVTVDVTVRNTDATKRLPFGFGLHPYFNLHGSRDSIRIQVPMQKWLDQSDGELYDPSFAKYDLRVAQDIRDMVIDDVYVGMRPEAPMTLTYETIGKRLVVASSEIFTHSVIYSPENAPYICLESWTCSHDAHNLASRGKTDAAHLLVLEPGESIQGTVEYRVELI